MFVTIVLTGTYSISWFIS